MFDVDVDFWSWTPSIFLPTPSLVLSEVRSKMDDAVSQRKYAEAEQHRARITELAEEKALAIEQEQSSPSPKDPSASSRVSE